MVPHLEGCARRTGELFRDSGLRRWTMAAGDENAPQKDRVRPLSYDLPDQRQCYRTICPPSYCVADMLSTAVWKDHIISSSAVGYGRNVLRRAKFRAFWEKTSFWCGKWSSMRFYEGKLHSMFNGSCLTYTKVINGFSRPSDFTTHLPFYTHNNAPDSLHVWDLNASLILRENNRSNVPIPCGLGTYERRG